MSTAADNSLSATARRLPLRKRADLEIVERFEDDRKTWVVKDPVCLRYFRFREEEQAILGWLDGDISLDEIQSRYSRRFAPRRITSEELHVFIASLHRNSLVTSTSVGQGNELFLRGRRRRRERVVAMVANPLAIRFRGIDPQRLLNWLYPRVRWIFSRWFLTVAVALVLAALALVAARFDTFQARLPALGEFFQGRTVVWMLAGLALIKVVHELGHALTCRHFGGECHEIGVMLLVFMPTLFCNVSDTWVLPSKWQRAAVAAAGVIVEVLMAALASLVWWHTEPGLLNHLCLAIMTVCSLNSLLLNGNPLLRYDGYFVLSSLLEIPNLMQRSRAFLTAELAQLCLGIETPRDRTLPGRRRVLFVLYAAGSTIYRWVVLLAILWYLDRVLAPYDLQILGRIAMLGAIASMLLMPVIKIFQYVRVPGRIDLMQRSHVLATLAVVGAAALILFFVPFPSRVQTPLVIEARDAARVYVTTPGRLDQVDVRAGDAAESGKRLALLTSPDLALRIAELKGQVDEQRLHVKSLERQRAADPSVGSRIPPAKQALADLEDRLGQLHEERDRLTLSAPTAGTVLPPPRVDHSHIAKGKLVPWSGTPLDPVNAGAWLETATAFCLVGDPQRLEAVLLVDQGDVEFVAAGQRVEVLLDELPGRTWQGTIAEVAEIDTRTAPRQLAARLGGDVSTRRDAQGGERLANASYQVRVPLDDADGLMLLGLRGRAKVHVSWQPLAPRLWRWITSTFRF